MIKVDRGPSQTQIGELSAPVGLGEQLRGRELEEKGKKRRTVQN